MDDLRTLIKECVQEAFNNEEGWMQAVNVRENVNKQTKPIGRFGSTDFFWGDDPQVVSVFNNTGLDVNMTVERRGDSYYIQLDK